MFSVIDDIREIITF